MKKERAAALAGANNDFWKEMSWILNREKSSVVIDHEVCVVLVNIQGSHPAAKHQ